MANSTLEPFKLDTRSLSREMKRLVAEIGKDTISGDYHNPLGVLVDPLFVIHEAEFAERGAEAKVTRTQLDGKAYSMERFERPKRKEEKAPRAPGKISPGLRDMMQRAKRNAIFQVVLTFGVDDGVRIPLWPDLDEEEQREKQVKKVEQVIGELQERRTRHQNALLEKLELGNKRKVHEHFWLTNAVALELTRAEINRLSRSDAVIYLQPVQGGESPPQDADPDNDPVVARGHINSDPYLNLNLTSPWIGLLDTGVRQTHTMFNNPDRIAFCMDCVNGGPNCNQTSNAGFNCGDIWPHGTASAGILSGNANRGDRFRGVTAIRLDSWQIYTTGGLNTTATIRAIQRAVAVFDKVLVGELQANESESGAIATAADAAYDAGAIFVSANGNFGPNANTVRSPAIAHKVLGVGGFMTVDESQYVGQSRGPATDGRFKPDIQAPTRSETAHGSGDNALSIFGGTSGATPYASSAAMLARNWLRQVGSYDNGQSYAMMILWGQNPWPYDNTQGAGRLRMGTGGTAFWGKVGVLNGATINIPISVGTGRQVLDAALWWPETVVQPHNVIDLFLIDPGGTERARGYSWNSIFERARVGGTLTPGTWTLRIQGYQVNTFAQVVYWAARIGR
jgi:serine protease AprX